MKNYLKTWVVLLLVLVWFSGAVYAEEFKFSKTVMFPFDKSMEGGMLILTNVNGSLDILPAKDNNAKIEISYAVTASSRETAEALAEQITKISNTSGKLKCQIQYEEKANKFFGWFKDNKYKNIKTVMTAYIPMRFTYKKGEFASVNGNVTLPKELKMETAELYTIKGNILCNATLQSVKAANVQGDIKIMLNKLAKGMLINANNVNGNITVSFKKNKDLAVGVKATTVAGPIETNIPALQSSQKGWAVGKILENQMPNFASAKYGLTVKAHTVKGKVMVNEE